MKIIKGGAIKIALSTLMLLIVLSNVVFAGGEFRDINLSSDYAKESIIELAANSIIKGDENGYFKPANTVRRGEMITMIVRALEVDTNDLPDVATFKDVPTNHWAFKYVEAAHREGIVKGISPDEFGVDLESTREQMAAMFVRALGITDNYNEAKPHFEGLVDKDLVSYWAIEEVEAALATGLMQGVENNRFAPQGAAKREQVAVIIHRFIKNRDDLLAEVKHPHLYATLEKYSNLQYKGEINTILAFAMTDLVEEFSFIMEMEEKNIINGINLHSMGEFKILDSEGEGIVEEYEMIIMGNKLYIRDFEEDIWTLLEDDEIILKDGNIEGYVIGRDLYENYNDFNIEYAGEVVINDESTSKYVIQLSKDEALGLMPGDNLEMLKLLMDDLYNDDLYYIFEIYINENYEIIKLSYTFNGTMIDEEEMLEVELLLQMYFNNIGQEIEIKEPDPSKVVVFDFDDFIFDFEDFDFEDFDFDNFDFDNME
ncbi:S-layer homology domain-containing protein [Alkaliphilus peptidifermentans]|uniref:S-layer homology domain-containing protein n=1 Tax=Alkaliphilus peptidifermentans DSM 18978 TaxID=1120976 RepID=A0A1G5LCD9_9FIRM|nr:S-layer homology domain-containing protein [Alkaliphilus peptidifermentans]SCZ10141.1 S-layer homology domain-containing protein [Alkaliphilus peptidifermentans DSM 18978]